MISITNEYQLAWLLYLVAALGCFWAWTFFTRWMWRYLREPLWVATAVLLFSPTLLDPGSKSYVPSVVMAAMDLVFKETNNTWRAFADLALYGTLAAAVYALFVLARWLLVSRWLEPRRAVREQEAGLREQQLWQTVHATPPNSGLSARVDELDIGNFDDLPDVVAQR